MTDKGRTQPSMELCGGLVDGRKMESNQNASVFQQLILFQMIRGARDSSKTQTRNLSTVLRVCTRLTA
jgi:hypothetical protein